ncbi:ABC transporter I family member 11, chloroplastic [Linum perenne]
MAACSTSGIPSCFLGIGTIQSPSPFSRRSHSRNLNSSRIGRAPVAYCAQSCFEVRNVRYRPPGTQLNLLNDVSFSLPEKSFGLIFGQSGSGKSTLLQLLAGLNKPTSGTICIQRYESDGSPIRDPELLSPERVGIVFQFPERYFVADTILDEVTFGWPRQKGTLQVREQLVLNLQRAINWVGLNGISLDKDPQSLSGGYKRRLALAVQLVQVPDLLILDEPLAGLGLDRYNGGSATAFNYNLTT